MKENYVITKCSSCGLEWDIYKYNLNKKKTTLCQQCVNDARNIWDTKEKLDLSARYTAMKQRCYNKNHINYTEYGGRGVIICDEWLNDKRKYVEWCLNNGYKKELHIDKDILSKKLGINPPIYSPKTCMFVTAKDNSECKSSSVYINYKGRKQTISQWAKELGVEYKTLQYRLSLGWSDTKAIETPVGKIKPFAKTVLQLDLEGNAIREFESAREADRETGISFGSISNCIKGKSKTAGGYKWKLKEGE